MVSKYAPVNTSSILIMLNLVACRTYQTCFTSRRIVNLIKETQINAATTLEKIQNSFDNNNVFCQKSKVVSILNIISK